jgi:hypothetical protein
VAIVYSKLDTQPGADMPRRKSIVVFLGLAATDFLKQEPANRFYHPVFMFSTPGLTISPPAKK